MNPLKVEANFVVKFFSLLGGWLQSAGAVECALDVAIALNFYVVVGYYYY